MCSKKQRAKAGKAGKHMNDASVKTSQPSSAHQSANERTTTNDNGNAVRCYCAACTAPPSTADNSKSPFLRIPREVRDKIYAELLIAKNPPEKQAQIEEIKVCTSMPFGDFCLENALEGLDDTGIMPGSDRKYPFIVDAMGLLLANKQIHAEANSVLFSENTFVILAEWERVWPFWRCDRADCDPPGRPCFIMFHNFLQVKHLEILVHNTQPLESRGLRIESARLRTNLETVATCFTEAGNQLKTLKVRYTSCFGGQVEAMRDAIEVPIPAGIPERPISLKDDWGKYHHLKQADAQRQLFTHCAAVLAPLLQMKGVAEAVYVRGDLPSALIDQLTTTMSAPEPPGAVKKKLADERARKQAVRDKDRRKEAGQRNFWQEMMEKNLREGDQGGADLCRKMMGMSIKSPAVMAELMAPPSRAELENMRRLRTMEEPAQAIAVPGTVTETDDDGGEDDVVTTGGGIGVMNGKPVFGPSRPPGLD